MATLYEITDQFRQLYEMADEYDLTQADIADTLEGLDYELEEKADAYAKVIRSLEEDCDSLKAEIDRLSGRKKTMENNIKNMKKSLETAMRLSERQKIKTTLFSFGIQKNPPKLVIDDEKAIPKQFLIPQPDKIDSTALKAMLKAIPEDEKEICPYAHLEQSSSLRIR